MTGTTHARSLLLATDLSPRCDRATDRAIALAGAWRVRAVAATVVEWVERPAFSIEAFLRGRPQGLNYLEAREFDAFLDKVMGGIDAVVMRGGERR